MLFRRRIRRFSGSKGIPTSRRGLSTALKWLSIIWQDGSFSRSDFSTIQNSERRQGPEKRVSEAFPGSGGKISCGKIPRLAIGRVKSSSTDSGDKFEARS